MYRGFLSVLVGAFPTLAAAQNIPVVAVEVAAGTGSHSERSEETWFRNAHKQIFHIAGIVRLATGGSRFATVGRIEYNSGGMADETSDCPLAPDGSCRRYFPKTEGWTGGLGLAAVLTSRLNLEVGAGVIQSIANRYVSAGVSFALGSHFGVLAEWRQFDLVYAGDRRIWFRPIQAGIRFF
jgi:hypothetical protein